jgi:putative transposase
LATAVLIEAHDEWQIADRRYLSEGSMACSPRSAMITVGRRR